MQALIHYAGKLAFGVALAVGAASAQAAVAQAHGYTFFDENGQVVGQTIMLCTNQGGSYGNVHTAYHVTEYSSCNSPGAPTHPESIVPGTHVTAYTLPGFMTIQDACRNMHCSDEGTIGLMAFWPINDYGPWVTPPTP
jgi:hypothetical protein